MILKCKKVITRQLNQAKKVHFSKLIFRTKCGNFENISRKLMEWLVRPNKEKWQLRWHSNKGRIGESDHQVKGEITLVESTSLNRCEQYWYNINRGKWGQFPVISSCDLGLMEEVLYITHCSSGRLASVSQVKWGGNKSVSNQQRRNTQYHFNRCHWVCCIV